MVIRFDNNHIVTIKDILMSVSTSTKFKHVSYLWDEAKYHAPYAVHFRMAILAWNAVTTKINAGGQVEGTCVGKGMAFDPAFYYYRPVNVYAAHGYGPVLLAGAEIINLLKAISLK
jgi:unsaturated rhamnogalacturonyl hydrolase